MVLILLFWCLCCILFFEGVEVQGVKVYMVYNCMFLLMIFESLEVDYWYLKDYVQVWDVFCECQVELCGLDVGKFM